MGTDRVSPEFGNGSRIELIQLLLHPQRTGGLDVIIVRRQMEHGVAALRVIIEHHLPVLLDHRLPCVLLRSQQRLKTATRHI